MHPPFRGLYAMADVDAARAAGHGLVDAVEALLAARPPVLQLRYKTAPDARTLLEAARAVAECCRVAGVRFVLNDRVDVAVLAGADGVHLGQEDLPIAEARRLMPPGAWIGVSTHTPAQVAQAVADGADYLGFGPVYATRSKDRPDPVVGPARLAEAVRLAGRIPVVAIGGITLETVPEVARAGAACAAVIADVLAAPDVRARAEAVHRAFLEAAP